MHDRYLPLTSYRSCRLGRGRYWRSRTRRVIVWAATWYGWLVVALILAASAAAVCTGLYLAVDYIASHTGR